MMDSPPQSTNMQENVEDSFYDAVKTGDINRASILLSSRSVNVDSPGPGGKTALTIAVEKESVKMTQLLLLHGADINVPCYSNMYCTFETPVITAARLGNMRILNILLQHGTFSYATESRVGKTALQWAATYGDIDMASLLLSHGSDINWIGPYFHTALHYAATSGKTDMAKFLLDSGAEVNVNGEGRTPLHTAAVHGNMPMLRHFVSRNTDINQKDTFQFSPFTLACLRGHLVVLEYFLEHCDTVPDLNDGLHKAAECGHTAVMRFLLAQGADVNSRDASGATALTIASKGQYAAVKMLLESGACYSVRDNRGFSALHCALQREQYNTAELLVFHGAGAETIRPKNDGTKTRGAASSALQSIFECPDPSLARLLVLAGCDLRQEDWLTVDYLHHFLEDLEENNNVRPHRLRMRYQSELDAQREICHWFLLRLQSPASLADVCRACIRRTLVEATGHRSIVSAILHLPLPQSLQSYLSLEELCGKTLAMS